MRSGLTADDRGDRRTPLLIACLLHHRRTLGRLHPASAWGALALVLNPPLRPIGAESTTCLTFADWLTT